MNDSAAALTGSSSTHGTAPERPTCQTCGAPVDSFNGRPDPYCKTCYRKQRAPKGERVEHQPPPPYNPDADLSDAELAYASTGEVPR